MDGFESKYPRTTVSLVHIRYFRLEPFDEGWPLFIINSVQYIHMYILFVYITKMYFY